MTELPSSIRKAAVLILALDERTADVLLDQMPVETAQRVRLAIMELGDVPAAEQEAVLAEFLRGQAPRQPTTTTTGSDVELELSQASRAEDEPRGAAETHANESFDFLQQVPPQAISRALSAEHEQTIALVVSRLHPDLAAQVLEQLPADQATTVLERLAWLDEPAPEVLAEIERHLRAVLAAYAGGTRGPNQSLASVKALVGAMDMDARQRVLAGLGQRNGRLARELGFTPLASSSRSAATDAERYEVTAFRYRLERPEPAPAAIEFSDFATLSDDALRQILAAEEPAISLLALTGADESLIDRIVQPLPPREADVLRRRLNQPAAGRKGEIEAARRQLAARARRLMAEGTVVLPSPRRFAAAA